MSIDRIKELAQTTLMIEMDKALQDTAEYLYVILDEPIRLRLIDSLEQVIEKLRGPVS